MPGLPRRAQALQPDGARRRSASDLLLCDACLPQSFAENASGRGTIAPAPDESQLATLGSTFGPDAESLSLWLGEGDGAAGEGD